MDADRAQGRLAELARLGAMALHGHVAALLELLDLHAGWRDLDPPSIVRSLGATIQRLLRADLVSISAEVGGEALAWTNLPEVPGAQVKEALALGSSLDLGRPNALGRRHVRLAAATLPSDGGSLVVGSWRLDFPSRQETQLVETAAEQLTLALRSAQGARIQRRLAERSVELDRLHGAVGGLHVLAAELCRARTSREVGELALPLACGLAGAWGAALYVAEGVTLELLGSYGYPPQVVRNFSRVPLAASTPMSIAIRQRETLRFTSAEAEARFPELSELMRGHGTSAMVVLPMAVEGGFIGCLALSFRGREGPREEEAEVFEGAARLIAQAAARARLFDSERAARRAAERERRRIGLVAETSAILAVLDFEPILPRVARLVIPELADWCAVALAPGITTDSRELALAHRDPRLEEAARAALGHAGPIRCAPRATASAPVRAEISEHVFGRAGFGAEESRALAILGGHSVVLIPMLARGTGLGFVVLGLTDPGRSFEPADLEVATELGRRAALAIDHARLYVEARTADRRKDEFLAMLGHELRNPLSPIKSVLQLMQMKGDTHFARERAVMERQVEHLARLVDDLLDISRVTRGKLELKREILAFQLVLERAVEMVAPLIERQGHRLEVALPEGPIWVEGDPARLAQVVTNILGNAAKYTPPGGRIEVRLQREGAGLRLAVKDDGIGISPELLPRIFAAFVQDGRAIDRAQGGLGLGLAIARNLLELHGGTITADSRGPGMGTEVVLSLPGASPPEAARSARPEPVRAPATGGLRVLIVDDNHDGAAMLGQLLSSMGLETHLAYDGESALTKISELRPEAALVDIGLPLMDGYEVARRVRAGVGCPITLVAITGYGQEADRQRALEAGFDEHLVKPPDLERIFAILEARAAAKPEAQPAWR